jgi:hypothetical protein
MRTCYRTRAPKGEDLVEGAHNVMQILYTCQCVDPAKVLELGLRILAHSGQKAAECKGQQGLGKIRERMRISAAANSGAQVQYIDTCGANPRESLPLSS